MTTTTLMTTMTDSAPAKQDPRFVVSARVKILAWMLLIVFFAMGITLFATQRVLIAGVDATSSMKLSHEARQFHAFVNAGDPTTEEPFTNLEELFEAHLAQQLPEPSETFFTLVNGEAFERSDDDPPVRLDADPRVRERVTAVTEPVSFREQTEAGTADIAVIPVQETDGAQGALVIVQFLGPAQQEVADTVRTMAIISLVALALASGIGWAVAGRVLAPIRTLKDTAEHITENDLSARIDVTGTDDVARLAVTFNRMLDRLEAAFAAQRQFLDDAGHELRTPITVVRGHLELMGEDPEERHETLRLVTDELARMARLVDDLTLLARSERPDFVQPAPVQLSDLVVDALTHATRLGDRNFTIAALPEATIIADEQRLLQALMQLVANAVKHTRAGDSIAIGGSAADGVARLWVSDTGVGIAAADQGKLFERFRRGSSEVVPSTGVDLSLGIGLEIVARIAEAHGGSVDVQSELGDGATFTLTIPIRDA